jgi:hypothetical protein
MNKKGHKSVGDLAPRRDWDLPLHADVDQPRRQLFRRPQLQAVRRRHDPVITRAGYSGIVLALALASCGAASGHAPNSGIAARVLAAPTCPVETIPPRPQCAPRPLEVGVRVRRAGQSGARIVHSGADGRFRVRLSPGIYIVQGLPEANPPLPRPPAARRVRVRAGRFTSITITYDTGIR